MGYVTAFLELKTNIQINKIINFIFQFRRGLVRFVCKVSKSSEKHVCNPKAASIQAAEAHHTIHVSIFFTFIPKNFELLICLFCVEILATYFPFSITKKHGFQVRVMHI